MNDCTTNPPFKRCTKCGQEFLATTEFFPKHKQSVSGLDSWCRICHRNCHRERRKIPEIAIKEREEAKLRARKRRANPDIRKVNNQKRREKYANDPDYAELLRERKRQRRTNPEIREQERLAAQIRRLSPEVRERDRQNSRERLNNPLAQIKIKEYQQSDRYRLIQRLAGQKRRAKKKALVNDLTEQDWLTSLEYFNGCCAVCGRQLIDLFRTHKPAADHWIPLSKGGGTTRTNIIPLCHGKDGCNNSKHDRLPDEWLISVYGKRKAKQILKRISAYFEWLKSQ